MATKKVARKKKKPVIAAGKKPAAKKKAATKKGPKKRAKAAPGVKKAKAGPKKDTGFPIVGLGASAGGLEALEAFFSHMPYDSDIAFVVIQHLSPKHKSIMGALLSKCTQMEVVEIKDGLKLESNRVYLNPPDKNVTIINGTLQLMAPVKTSSINLPIDCFFRSMSEDLGEKAICIILSGTATDGTLGLKAVKGEGGIAMVQAPDSAKYDGMPRSAIATGIVDFIEPVEKLPAKLIKYVNAPYIGVPKKVEVTDNQFANYLQKVFALIRSATGHDLSHYKQTTIRRRIERRLAVHQIDKISNYVKYLQTTPAEVDILFKDMLIGVTNFFRDTKAFKVLETKAIPALLQNRRPDSTIRIWIVGCSTGEEAYSIAILFSEILDKMKQHFNLQIFASDIDAQAIEHARTGTYPDSIAADVSQARLNQFFVKEDNTYRVKKAIREMIIFAVQNVINDPPFSKIDLVSCRNLLIYMNPELQKKVLPLCHYTLNPDGVLFLGSSESIGEFTDLFRPINVKWKVFRRKDFYVEKLVDYPVMPFYRGNRDDEKGGMRQPADINIHDTAERVILDNFAPAGVLVNERYEIMHFMGKTDKYLEAPVGKANFNILKMAREGLKLKLNTALHNAVRQKKTIVYESLRVKYNGKFRIIDLTVRPLLEVNIPESFFLVMFDDKTPSRKPVKRKGKGAAKDDSSPIVTSLERELESTKETLQTTIEEMETSNEELKSTNEELQSVNEELQSTNEELETSKEELQSTNEELVTVNTELQNKVDELSQVNNDISNLLASTEIGTIFLDTDLNIKRFTPAMTKIFNLIQKDIDRPIGHITTKIEYGDLVTNVEEVLKTLSRQEHEVRDKKGNWYVVNISPYRTIDNVIEGIVMTFVDVTQVKQSAEKERRLAAVVRDSYDAITVQDFEGNIKAWNRGAENLYGWTEAEALKMNIKDIIPAKNLKETLAFLDKVRDGENMRAFKTKRKTNKGKVVEVWLTVTILTDSHGNPYQVATTERDLRWLPKD